MHLRKKGILTFYKKSASAHHLRHSLATLNIQPLGLFSLYEIVERLRHSKYETAKKHYIHDNPYLQKQKFEAFKSRYKKKSCREILKGIPIAEFEAFFIEELRLDPDIVSTIRKKLRNLELPKQVEGDKLSKHPGKADPEPSDMGLTSKEVRKKLAAFKLKFKTFSRFCRENGYQEKRGRDVFFNEAFVDDLVEHWVRREEVMEVFNLSRSRFYQLLEEKKWPMMKIGKYRLVRLKKFLQSAKNRSFVGAEESGPIRPINKGRFVQSESLLRA